MFDGVKISIIFDMCNTLHVLFSKNVQYLTLLHKITTKKMADDTLFVPSAIDKGLYFRLRHSHRPRARAAAIITILARCSLNDCQGVSSFSTSFIVSTG